MTLEELKQNWELFNCMNKIEFSIEFMYIYSVISTDVKSGIVICYKISPSDFKKDQEIPDRFAEKVTITITNSTAFFLAEKTKIFFEYENRFYFPTAQMEKSFTDLFGFSRESLENTVWRNLHLARLFKEEGFALATYENHNGARILHALHKTMLDGIETDLYSLTKRIVTEKKAEIVSFESNKTSCQVELAINGCIGSWKQGLVIRDSLIGRESLTFYNSWNNGKASVYTEEKKYLHRSQMKEDDIMTDVWEMVENARQTFSIPEIGKEDVVKRIKPIIGNKRVAKLRRILSFAPENNSEEILKAALGAVYSQQYEGFTLRIRTEIGKMIREAA